MTHNKCRVSGSPTFGTTNVKTDEYIILAKTMVANGTPIEQAALDIAAIDDMLSLLKVSQIIRVNRFTKSGKIRKDASLMDLIDKRVDQLLEDSKQLQHE